MISGQSETKATHFNKQTNRFEKTAVFTAAEVAKKKTVDPASAFFCEVCKVNNSAHILKIDYFLD